ncbi:MAG: metallophosphoesterase [Chloroflexi bacterium AL-N10]|nr:metallophosphoesterase [Chloroflexi bacterium AL-N10]
MMSLKVRFAIISDLHIATPPTIWQHENRFHLVELSIPALEFVLENLEKLPLDFLLIPGDLTQHGEPENHQWLQKRLQSLPFPVYVVPGNHDIPTVTATENSIAPEDFSRLYQSFGYDNSNSLYYTREILPGLQLVALNSNQFNQEGKQLGFVDDTQLIWLENVLNEYQHKTILLMIHHNVIEHLPGQANHELGKRYMLENAPRLLRIIEKYGVQLIFTGHLHIQDISEVNGIYEITTGSLVSYPHPYRILELSKNSNNNIQLQINSYHLQSLPDWDNLPEFSRNFLGDRSYYFMIKLLTTDPLNLSLSEADKLAPELRNFWADIAGGDAILDFPNFPPEVRSYFQKFGANKKFIDNNITLIINNSL